MPVRKKITPSSTPSRLTKEVSAMAWIQDPHGRVLLVRQNRGKKLWTLPGGKVESGETVDAGLRREVMEETGVKVSFASFIAIFDRSPKANLTILYRVVVPPGAEPAGQLPEISAAAYFATLPPNSTPSLQHFWRLLRKRIR